MSTIDNKLKLSKKIEITGKIICKTGLHIGGSGTSMNIGGIDKCVIRNPLNNQPYIPGSSLKGKMRALFQVATGSIKKLDKPMGGEVYHVATDDGPDADLFGSAAGDSNQKPSRLIVRDCYLVNAEELLKHTEIPYTEGKTEVVIDRITSAASPRQIERVPAGAVFGLNIILNIWEQDNNEDKLIHTLFKSLELLKDDYLGGNGSRGYGQIAIEISKMVEKDCHEYYGYDKAEPKDISKQYAKIIEKLIQ
ncbi:MAG: type III-A CRISPR-associated RAMP protein Csm3 [Bacteroidales bacterium]|nr:type III-A CRISPR-associated RAMP protein Csm3 [Bacteroidales bacterium]